MTLQQEFYDKVWDALQQSQFNLLMTHASNFQVYKSMGKTTPCIFDSASVFAVGILRELLGEMTGLCSAYNKNFAWTHSKLNKTVPWILNQTKRNQDNLSVSEAQRVKNRKVWG